MEHWEGTVEEVVTAEFWVDKSVLITGHTGFKGSWLALWLQTLGARVVGYALDPPTSPSLYSCTSVSSGMTSLRGDGFSCFWFWAPPWQACCSSGRCWARAHLPLGQALRKRHS